MSSKKPIKIKPSRVGLFTEKARKNGMSVQQYANHVLAPNSHANQATKKQAQFAHNAAGFKHK